MKQEPTDAKTLLDNLIWKAQRSRQRSVEIPLWLAEWCITELEEQASLIDDQDTWIRQLEGGGNGQSN